MLVICFLAESLEKTAIEGSSLREFLRVSLSFFVLLPFTVIERFDEGLINFGGKLFFLKIIRAIRLVTDSKPLTIPHGIFLKKICIHVYNISVGTSLSACLSAFS